MIYQIENFNGHMDFRCGLHDGWIMESHIHEYSEILYCQKGACTVIINGLSISLNAGYFIWIPPNYIHQYECENATVICAVFSKDFIPLYFQETKEKRLLPQPIEATDLKPTLDLFYTMDKKNHLLISGYLNLIAHRVIEQSQFESTKQTDGILYQKVISYLSVHFREEITLKKIAKLFGYNEKYLSHSLHELTGVHFSHLLSLYRLNHAKELLLSDSENSISKIAQDCGFSALNTFNRVFKESTGMTPSQYRISLNR